jgi:diadenosine tetraphosphate (Ap4A) HIT family hydrolase
MTAFVLHPQLAADTTAVTDLPLCRLLLSNDANYPWFILVPRREGIREIHELDDADQQQLLRESMALSRALMAEFKGDKLNIAALGNVVPQLHVHHIVRYRNDPAWPAPVWGKVPAASYDPVEQQRRVGRVRERLSDETSIPD